MFCYLGAKSLVNSGGNVLIFQDVHKFNNLSNRFMITDLLIVREF